MADKPIGKDSLEFGHEDEVTAVAKQIKLQIQ